jgi:diguanylate cyclase (GGDEF)-like protein/PAS domain S-box-containing protein
VGQISVPAVSAVLDVVQELLCVVDDHDAVAWAGPAWARELGLEPGELAGRPLGELVHPDDRERLAQELRTLREHGRITSGFECRIPSAVGATHWVRWTGVEGPDGLILSGRDVTALREPGRGGDELVASALDAIVSIDADDRIVEFNPSAERTFGVRREDVLGRSLTDLIVFPAQGAHSEGVTRGAPFGLLGQRLEVKALRADGAEFPAELTITQTSTDPLRVTAFVRDRSAEHGAREALRESEARYGQAFDQAPVGIALISIDPADPGRLLRVNAALSQMTGYAEDVLLAGTFSDFTHPDDIAANQALFAEVLAGRTSGYEIEKRFLRNDGSVMWGFVSGTVVRDAEGQPLYGIGQVQDITVRKAAEEALRTNEHRLARTERLARIGAWEWDVERDRFSWSTGLEEVWGTYDPARAPSMEAFLSIVQPGDRDRIRQILAETLEGQVIKTWEYSATRDGELIHVYAWGEVVLGDDGAPAAIQGYAQDVTERRRAEERVEGLRRDNDLILDAAGEGIFRIDVNGCTTYANPAAGRLLGCEPAVLIGQSIHELIHNTHPDGTPHAWEDCPIRSTVATGEQHRVTDDVLWRGDGTALAAEYTIAPMRDGDAVTGAVIVFNDVTERREMEDRLRVFAERDALTGLMNRRRFEEALAEHLADRRAAGGALLLLDLDHFKFVNDSFGHAAGDDLVRAIATGLSEHVRGTDMLARLGGDEFAVLLPSASADDAAAMAHRLVAVVEESRPSGLQVGASVGVTCFAAGDETTAGDLLVSADIALYEAKERGRGRVEFFTGQPGASLTWVQRIRAALAENRFVLHAQPIIDLATGETTQEELLIRMVDEHGGVIAPAQFLPTAEAFGLIGNIDRWVVAQGVAMAAGGSCVHINLSGRSVGNWDLLNELDELLKSTGADPANLVFELTETAAITNMANARAFGERLQRLGCRLALDDFGTGFGPFTYLRNLPADFLKIDRDFVCNLTRSEADMRVVEAIVDIAARFGMRTVAEGVEDEGALLLLSEAGVDYAQGYHLGRPAPIPGSPGPRS